MGFGDQRVVVALFKVMDAAGADVVLQNRPDPWHPSIEMGVPDGWFVGIKPVKEAWVLGIVAPGEEPDGGIIGKLSDPPERIWSNLEKYLNGRADLTAAKSATR